jgi:hypothetical protein
MSPNPRQIAFINAAHTLTHYSLMVLPTAVLAMAAPGGAFGDTYVCLDGYQRRAVDRDEYIEIKAGAAGAWHLIGPGTVGVEGVSYWGRR